ncbi:MAG TPA: hypothetical protein VMJ31_11875 [Methylocystis sp.]|nr:hypothetical protein [Methylocystis sp.]
MIASFDRDELMASLAELEKRVREHAPSRRLAAAPSAQLDIDLAAILTLAKSRNPLEDAPLEDAARLADDPPPDQAAPPRSTAVVLVPEKELLASAAGKEIALSRPHRWVYVPAAILMVIGSLVISASHFSGRRVLGALQVPPALQKFDPPPETIAQAPAAQQTPESGPVIAETAAVAPPPPVAIVGLAAPETTAQAPAAKQITEGGPATTETAAVAPPPPVANALAAVEPPAPAVEPPTPEATIAKPANPAKKRKKARSDLGAFIGKLAGGVTAALRHVSSSLTPR